MSNKARRALVIARPRDMPKFKRALRERGYVVDGITSIREEIGSHDYDIVCVGGCLIDQDDLPPIIEWLRQMEEARSPSKRRLRRVA